MYSYVANIVMFKILPHIFMLLFVKNILNKLQKNRNHFFCYSYLLFLIIKKDSKGISCKNILEK